MDDWLSWLCTYVEMLDNSSLCRHTLTTYCKLPSSKVLKTFLKKFRGQQSFLLGHWCPCFGLLVTSPLGFKARVDSSLVCFIICMQLSPQIHLWCDTCWPLDGQHDSRACLIHILVHVFFSVLSRLFFLLISNGYSLIWKTEIFDETWSSHLRRGIVLTSSIVISSPKWHACCVDGPDALPRQKL